MIYMHACVPNDDRLPFRGLAKGVHFSYLISVYKVRFSYQLKKP